jgi:large subunit ribosomal protein L10e
MGLRPAKCYRNIGHKQRPYTRLAIKVPKRNYIGASPALRIRQYNMGNSTAKYDLVADLFVKENYDLRDNAIESARIAINRKLVKALGKDGFFMKVRVTPNHIIRENKQAQGAGADRISQGMSLSFGVPVGRAARVKKGQVIFSILLKNGQEKIVREALMRAKAKFSSDVAVKIHKNIASIGTIPAKKIEDVNIAVKETTEVEAEKPGAKTKGKKDEKTDAKDAGKKDEKTDAKAKPAKK